ncbi:MAG: hypothetical protein Tsb006_1180 [Rickettsiaceae bacterium]
MNIENRAQFIKKLLYQSCNRGCKETDIIIGSFARENLGKMTDSELVIFEGILHLSDADIYDWYTNKKDVPMEHQSSVLAQIFKFDPTKR